MSPLNLDLSSTDGFKTGSSSNSSSFLIDPLSPPMTPTVNKSLENNPFNKINLGVIRNSNVNLNGLAAKLRKATAEAHSEVMQPLIVSQLMSGQLPSHLHLRYLMMLHEVYTTLELSLSYHTTHPYLSLISNPALLNRSTSLYSDCSYFSGEPDWKENSEVWSELEDDNVNELMDYLIRLRELREGGGMEGRLLAHAYVRYLGDLSGGQQIARTIRKSYSLPSSNEGSSFYDFQLPPYGLPYLPSDSPISTQASSSDVKAIKEWFREGLDQAGELMTEEEILEIIVEAKEAYRFNLGLFKSFLPVVERERLKSLKEEDEKREILLRKRKGLGEDLEWIGKKTSSSTWIAVLLAFVLGSWILVREWSRASL